MGDTGLTGRKIIVDTYGGAAPTGAGPLGQGPTKVDRFRGLRGALVAKNLVAAGLAERCQIQVAYAIGVAHPLSVLRGHRSAPRAISVPRIEELVREHFDLRPAAILRDLDLRRPIYAKTAAYGHFGREDGASPGSGPTAPTRCASGGARGSPGVYAGLSAEQHRSMIRRAQHTAESARS